HRRCKCGGATADREGGDERRCDPCDHAWSPSWMNGGRCERASRHSEGARFVTGNSELAKQRTDYFIKPNNFCARSFVYVVWSRNSRAWKRTRAGIAPALVVSSLYAWRYFHTFCLSM